MEGMSLATGTALIHYLSDARPTSRRRKGHEEYLNLIFALVWGTRHPSQCGTELHLDIRVKVCFGDKTLLNYR